MFRQIWWIIAGLITSQANAGFWLGSSLGYEMSDTSFGDTAKNITIEMAESAPLHSVDLGYRYSFDSEWSLSLEGQFLPFSGRETKDVQVNVDVFNQSIDLLSIDTKIKYEVGLRLMPTWRYSKNVELVFPFGLIVSNLKVSMTELGSTSVRRVFTPSFTLGAGARYRIDKNWSTGLIFNFGFFRYSSSDMLYSPHQQRIMLHTTYEF